MTLSVGRRMHIRRPQQSTPATYDPGQLCPSPQNQPNHHNDPQNFLLWQTPFKPFSGCQTHPGIPKDRPIIHSRNVAKSRHKFPAPPPTAHCWGVATAQPSCPGMGQWDSPKSFRICLSFHRLVLLSTGFSGGTVHVYTDISEFMAWNMMAREEGPPLEGPGKWFLTPWCLVSSWLPSIAKKKRVRWGFWVSQRSLIRAAQDHFHELRVGFLS